MKKKDFNYKIPPSAIAQTPKDKRDTSWLMILNRTKKTREHKKFSDIINYLKSGDLLILNDTKVIPARLLGRKIVKGKESARVEILLLNLYKHVFFSISQSLNCGHSLSKGSDLFENM